MSRPPLFPVLRRALGAALEGKSLTIGGRYGGLSARTHTYGMRDASAGWDYDAVVTDGYERVVWVWKAVEIISGNASRLPFQVTVDDDEVENHPLLRVLNKRANPSETGRQFRKRLSAQILLSKKGAFVEVTTSRAGRIVRLDLLDPSRVRVVPDPGGDYVDYFEYTRYDGEVRPLSPHKVRWIREPHPFDPFSGVTPLEAAGLSIDLDRLARSYNVNFINRDGRPGGIVGVDVEGIPETELDRISARFKPGVQHAGEITAIGTGKGGLDYIDTSARPRDMAYETTSQTAKKEILAAFGVPESIAGDASERTFDNAAQETFTFWHEVMIPHLDLIASAFDGDVDDDADCGFDTAEIEALEMPARRRREEARTEVREGLRSPKEYRDLRPELDVIDTPQTRALWLSPAKAPVPARPEDADDLGLSEETPGGGQLPPGGGGPPALGPGGTPLPGETAGEVVAAALAELEPGSTAAVAELEGEAAAAVQEALAGTGQEAATAALGPAASALQDALEGKALDPQFVIVPNEPRHSYDPGEDEARRVELAVTAALDATLARQAGVVAARLQSSKVRRGTRYWVAESPADDRVGEDPIDATRVIDTARWAAEVQETLLPIVPPATQQAANDLLTAMAATGAITLPAVAGAVVAGRTTEAAQASAEQIATAAAQAAAAPSLLALTVAVNAFNDWQDARIDDLNRLIAAQADAPDLSVLVEQVRKVWADEARQFTESVAVTVSQAAVSGGRDAAAAALTPTVTTTAPTIDGVPVRLEPEVARTWCTRNDEKVRAAHKAASGQTVGVGEPFLVGGHELRFPSDPLGPPSVSRWCRCWVRYEWTEGATFILPTSATA